MSAGLGLAAKARHFAIAYARNLQATRLLSAIAIIGLAIGIAGALLLALIARETLGYNGFVPDHARTYLGISVLSGPGMAPVYNETSNDRAAASIKANIPDVEGIARLAGQEVELRRAGIATRATIYWADPDFFAVMRLPVIAGQIAGALARPDGIVMTRSEAIRHFGRADAIGSAIDVAGTPMILRAVIADLPARQTDLKGGIFASGLTARSPLAQGADVPGAFSIGARTYMRLRPGASAEAIERRMAPLIDGLLPPPMRGAYRMRLVRIDRLALHEGFHPAARARLQVGSLVAALILFIAVANFINLSTALSARRWRDIGVRKACGASRGQIAAQYWGEAIATVLIATLLAAAAIEVLLPRLNALLDTQVAFDYGAHPALLLWLAAGSIALGLIAGAYPALLLSALPPAAVLRDRGLKTVRRSRVPDLLVTLQFAILIGLMIAMAVVYQQRVFAMTEALRVDIDQMLTVTAPCPASFRQEVARLPGVRAASCSGRELLDGHSFAFVKAGEARISTDFVSILPSGFALYGIAPIAGTLAVLSPDGDTAVDRIVINRTAVRRFGFASAQAAIGQTLPVPPDRPGPDIPVRIVAVVPDFSLQSVEAPIRPTFYFDRPQSADGTGIVSIKLVGRAIPETLAAIDRLWRTTGQQGPIERSFVSAHIAELYRNLARDTQMFGLFAGIAAFLACLGVAGMAVSSAERRTKEIGIRKALGARTDQVLVLLLARLSRPVLWANILAWPIAWWLMRDWLDRFAYRVPLHPWLFPAAGMIALLVAALSAAAQAFRVARQRPVVALRYE